MWESEWTLDEYKGWWCEQLGKDPAHMLMWAVAEEMIAARSRRIWLNVAEVSDIEAKYAEQPGELCTTTGPCLVNRMPITRAALRKQSGDEESVRRAQPGNRSPSSMTLGWVTTHGFATEVRHFDAFEPLARWGQVAIDSDTRMPLDLHDRLLSLASRANRAQHFVRDGHLVHRACADSNAEDRPGHVAPAPREENPGGSEAEKNDSTSA